jgi:undecaprenyl-diphosphatase
LPNLIPPIPVAHAVLLGLVQGATEFLPVSSTGHIRILPAELGWPDPGTAFSAIVQLGPIAAILSFFWRDLIKYWHGMQRSLANGKKWNDPDDLDARLGWYTIFGTIPLAIVGLAIEHKVDTTLRSLTYVAFGLIIGSVILLWAEFTTKRNRGLDTLTLAQAMGIGLAQVLALVPGASRSGTTITAGLFYGLDRESAARFSFLLSIPAITLAGVYKLVKTVHHSHLSGHILGAYLLATAIAGVVAYVVIRWLLAYLGNENHSTMPFIVYRILLGVVILVQLHSGRLTPDTGADVPPAAPPAAQAQAAPATLDQRGNTRQADLIVYCSKPDAVVRIDPS